MVDIAPATIAKVIIGILAMLFLITSIIDFVTYVNLLSYSPKVIIILGGEPIATLALESFLLPIAVVQMLFSFAVIVWLVISE